LGDVAHLKPHLADHDKKTLVASSFRNLKRGEHDIAKKKSRRRNQTAPKISVAMAGFQSLNHISNIKLDSVLDVVVLATAQTVVTIVNLNTMQKIVTTIACGNLQRGTRTHSTSTSLESFIAKSRRRKVHA
jgi:hypothetical protein